ncbi:Pectate lyase superfamily protein [Planctomycetes bacterium Pan216]|uniref:Pectate lyase superfamily protein n=1 Tax=Kolteria novifilia TaxID=2527975 RepID=A0A518B8B0_9BACT|nr:Pectate lyase superfamily protein [Planctomycetes bacterium Pan216]
MRHHRDFFLIALLVPMTLSAWASAEDSADSAPPVALDAAKFASVQDALDAVPRSGGIVRLPPGTILLDKPLEIKTGDTWLAGSGASTHLKNVNEEGLPAIRIAFPGASATSKTPSKDRLWRVQLSDLRITGNPKSGHGIEAYYIEEIFLHGITVSHHGRDGIHLYDCYEDPRVSDSLITYNKDHGLYLHGNHDIVVSGNHFEENGTATRCVDGFNLCMTGNNIDDHLGDGIVIEDTYGSVVSGNMIEECKGTGVVLDRDCYGITLSANVVAHNFGGGIDLRDAHGCAVSANTFTIDKGFGLSIGPGSGRLTVTGNNFSDTYVGGKLKRTGSNKNESDMNEAAGILLDGVHDIAIVGNLFAGLVTQPVTEGATKSEGILFENNVVVGTSAKKATPRK